MPKPSASLCRAFLVLSALAIPLIGSTAKAQHGVTPSLGGLFFDDVRARALDIERPGNGQPAYTFHRGYYRSLGPQGSAASQRRGYGEDPYANQVDYYSHSQRYGREFGRYSGNTVNRGSFFAPAYVSNPFGGGHYNFRLGPIPFSMSMGLNAEYNDNITRRRFDPLEEYIVGVDFGLNGSYNLTRYNRISLSVGVGVDHYFNHPEVNPYDDVDVALSLSDGSSINFDILLGDIVITIYDRFSISRLTVDDFALDDLDLFSAFTNDLGVVANWGINSQTAPHRRPQPHRSDRH